MDYTDIYLRQRRKDASSVQTPSRPVEVENATDQRVECMLRGAFSVQQLVDRIEGLSVRVDAFDEKMVNLTKLVKLAQGLQEEKEGDLRRQQQELRARLKRQEQITTRLQEELDSLREKFSSGMRDTVNEIRQESVNDLTNFRKQNGEQLNQIKLDLEVALNSFRKNFEQQTLTLQKEVSTKTTSQQEAYNNLREQLYHVEKTIQTLEASVSNESSRLKPLEENMEKLSETNNTLQQKIDVATNAIISFGEDQTRSHDAVIEEIESTRQWATRNLQRVKQHVETISTDVAQLQNGQVELTTRLNRVSCQAEVEYKKLRALLAQKAREAEALGTIVGKELGKVEDMAERHQALRTEASVLRGVAF
ncbi:uncharacterized protein TM35_000093050 [Trypanosoma theileri]|uniref:Uncharacterized protein n=1 Tax=Trypanosoma theileri TaxID=67003 RepID=A0A1X0P000_9TRYP|nr:uncharacterized protein TM35_000093050 [Trypanosoma theileri]ORC90255.1 hypothetical protein TM35_000093050 [Trypanosoma theileri]